MSNERDPKYADNGETEGLTARQLILEVRADVKDLKKADADHQEKGHGKHPTWSQVFTLMVGLITVFFAVTQLAG